MRIREATVEDRTAWDTFVDNQGGGFTYFDWKYVNEAIGHKYIPLLVENVASEIIGTLPIVKEKRYFSSVLHSDSHSGGLLLKKSLSDIERHEVISAILKYVDTNYSKGCSRFILRERLASTNELSEEPTVAFIDSGYRFRYDRLNHLPCTFALKLEPPFEENVWKGLWSSKLRSRISGAKNKGVVVIHDRELNYADNFIEMLSANYERHGSMLNTTKERLKMELYTFRDRAKLYVALLDNQLILSSVCYYNASTCFLWDIGSYTKDTKGVNTLCGTTAIEDACDAGYRFVDFGVTETSGQADFKQQFRGTRVPIRIYEKRYSIPRVLVELVAITLSRTWHDKTYFWKQRHRLWDRIIHW